MPTTLGAHVRESDLRQLLDNALTSHFMNYQQDVLPENEADKHMDDGGRESDEQLYG